MAAARPAHTAAGLVLIAALMGAAAGAQIVRDSRVVLATPPQDPLYFTANGVVSRLSAGFRALSADLYWIRTLQYYGGIQRAHKDGRRSPEAGPEYGSLFSFLDLTTTLDPLFSIAYRFGAVYLSESPPAGPGRPDLANRLLNKGLAARPDKWEYMEDIGFVHYWWDHDYEAAAAAFQRASEMPNAPWWLRSLAATTLAQGGDRRSSRLMWTTIYQTAEIDWLRNSAIRSLRQLDALDAIDRLQAAVDRARARGIPITDWTALARAGVVAGTPVDPTGTPFELSADGRVTVSVKSTLFPLPSEPRPSRMP
jgi:hypothetical protein